MKKFLSFTFLLLFIMSVVAKVKTAVSQSRTKKALKFGKIAGLEDEDETFFFIKK